MFSKKERLSFADGRDSKSLVDHHVRGAPTTRDTRGRLRIGDWTSINGPFASRGRVLIGRYCAFGRYVSCIAHDHSTNLVNQQVWLQERLGLPPCVTSKGHIAIGHNVWAGDKVTVVSGVRVGHGAVLAANALVSKDVPPFAIVGGNPARIIKMRFDQAIIEQLLEIRWWDWSFERMQRNRKFFSIELPPPASGEAAPNLHALVVD